MLKRVAHIVTLLTLPVALTKTTSSSVAFDAAATASASRFLQLVAQHNNDLGVENRYHSDESCDRVAQNSFGNHLRRQRRADELYSTPKGIQQVPNEKTVLCPLQSTATMSLYPAESMTKDNSHPQMGMPTTWLLENSSKLPVVVAFVHPLTGQEVSAVNAKITPPHADPQAVLMPGQWKAYGTMEGHVFHVYELVGSGAGGGGGYELGRLVLQHRVGLIPIRNRYATTNEAVLQQCADDAASLFDVPPMEDGTVPAAFQRTPGVLQQERCNILYRGFRNMVGCPVHAYFYNNNHHHHNNNASSSTTMETFKFHLGVNTHAKDFQNDWDAPTKFETTLVSHTYVFRLASHPSIVLDSYTATPTKVVDCPDDQGKSVPTSQRRVVSQHVEALVGMPLFDNAVKQQQQQHQPELVLTTSVMTAVIKNATSHYNNYVAMSETNHSSYDRYDNSNNQTEPSSQRRRHQNVNRNVYYTTAASFATNSRAASY